MERGISQKMPVPALEETRDEFRLTLSLRKSLINLFSHINKSGSLFCEDQSGKDGPRTLPAPLLRTLSGKPVDSKFSMEVVQKQVVRQGQRGFKLKKNDTRGFMWVPC